MEPPFDPRPGDYADMLTRAGRRRRNRRLRGATAASVVALAVAAQAVPASRDGGTSLHVANAPTPTAGAESPSPTPTKPTPSPTSPGVPPLTLPTLFPPSESPSPKPPPTPDPSHPEKPTPAPAQMPPAQYAYLPGAAPDGCATEQGAQSAPDTKNWCAVYAGPSTFEVRTLSALPFRLCRSDAVLTGAGTLTVAGEPDHWLKARALDAAGDVAWHWYGDSPPEESKIQVQPGDCVQWTIPWDVAVDPGTYRLNPVFIVDEYKPALPHEFTVEVER